MSSNDISSESFYSKKARKARRKAGRAAMSTEEKMTSFFSFLSQLCAFVFGAYGAYAFALFIENLIGLPYQISGLILYILVCGGVFLIPMAVRRKLEDRLIAAQYERRQIEKAIESAVEDRDISPLLPLCDPEWLSNLKAHSYAWRQHQKMLNDMRLRAETAQGQKEHEAYMDALSQCAPPDID